MKRKSFEETKLETYILNGLDDDKRKNYMLQTQDIVLSLGLTEVKMLLNIYNNLDCVTEFVSEYLQIPGNPKLSNKDVHTIDWIIREYKDYFANLLYNKNFMEKAKILYMLEENPLFSEESDQGEKFYENYVNKESEMNMRIYYLEFINIIINNPFVLNDLFNRGVIRTNVYDFLRFNDIRLWKIENNQLIEIDKEVFNDNKVNKDNEMEEVI